jgi:NAD(P)-dependent dehydrogenase (short-subunit alcohol dehydrogenase family)
VPQKVAIVTGASRGIGAGVTSAFREAGYSVVASAVSIPPSDDPDLLTVSGDLTDPGTAEQIVTQALARFGRIDSLINNAGIYIGKPFTDYTLEDYAAITGINLMGFFHITQRVIPSMVEQGSGHIVNVSTTLAENADSSRPAALPALTKGGLVAAARSLAIEYASRGIRVNTVSLGVIRSDLDASYQGLAEVHPLGRVGEISDVVGGILYLEQAPFVTGETLHIDGGEVAGH